MSSYKAQGQEATTHEGPLWPGESHSLCWHCCHSFSTVPVYLPKLHSTDLYRMSLSGNFCSWNCVKAYYFYSCKDKRKADSIHLITLLAFLTYHRPKYCPTPSSVHESNCQCLSTFKGIPMSSPKEILSSFGGSKSISEYRKDFMMITSLDLVERCFRNKHLTNNLNTLCSSKQRRLWTYSFHCEKTMIEKKEEQEEQLGRPVVFKKTTKHKSLFSY